MAVAVRGIRWDEGYEHAQILSGQVLYPAEHPLPYYLSRAFSLQTHGLAWLMMAGAGPVIVNGLRNVLFLLATLLPPYLFAAHLTGRVVWGFAAALIFLQGAYLEFDGSYPLAVWPQLYSNGPIGGGFALLTLYLGLAGYGRAAALCFGLLPAIHLGQFPPLLALAPIGVWYYWRQDSRAHWTHPFHWLVIGLQITLMLGLYLRFVVDAPPLQVVPDPAEVESIWRAYTFQLDPHRQFPPGNGHILMAGTLLLGALLSLRQDDAPARWMVRGLTLFSVVTAGTVWTIMGLHALLGEDLPRLFIVWMPYRLINLLPPVCLVLSVYAISRLRAQVALTLLGGAMAFGIAQPWLAHLLPEAINQRYVSGGEAVAFGLWGAAMMGAFRAWQRAAVATAIGVALLLPFHSFGGACVVLAAGVVLACRVLLRAPAVDATEVSLPTPRTHVAFATLAVVLAGALLAHQYQYRQLLPRTAVTQYLADESARRAELDTERNRRYTVLTPPGTYGIQAQSNMALAWDAATMSLISYVPELGPEIQRRYLSLYGVDPFQPGSEGQPDWRAVWRTREPKQWVRVAERYGISLIVAPADIPLAKGAGHDFGEYQVYRLQSILQETLVIPEEY